MRNNQAITFADTKGMSREKWLEARRKGIGGSDAPAIMGASPYSSPLSVYAEKIGEAEECETNEAMRQGNDFEEYVARRFTEATGIKLRKLNRILQHPECPWMLANIDRDVIGEDAGFESKTTNVFNRHDFEGGEVPLPYMWQCQHYMAVTGAAYWYLAVLVLGQAFYVFRIDRDEALIEQLVEAEREFWLENVQKRVPPLPIGSSADEEALGELYPRADADQESADLSEVNASLDLLALYKADMAVLEQKILAEEETVKLALGRCEKGASDRWRASWKNVTRNTIDAKRLREELPEVAAKYTNTTNSRTFRVTKVRTKGA